MDTPIKYHAPVPLPKKVRLDLLGYINLLVNVEGFRGDVDRGRRIRCHGVRLVSHIILQYFYFCLFRVNIPAIGLPKKDRKIYSSAEKQFGTVRALQSI